MIKKPRGLTSNKAKPGDSVCVWHLASAKAFSPWDKNAARKPGLALFEDR